MQEDILNAIQKEIQKELDQELTEGMFINDDGTPDVQAVIDMRQDMIGASSFIWAWMIPIFILAIVVLIGQWKLFEKTGTKGWEALLPVHNTYKMFEFGGQSGAWTFLIFIPYLGALIVHIWIAILLSKVFGKNIGFTIGMILLPFIFYPILGFGKAQYRKPSTESNEYNTQ